MIEGMEMVVFKAINCMRLASVFVAIFKMLQMAQVVV